MSRDLKIKLGLMVAGAILLSASSAMAATYTWVGGGNPGDYGWSLKNNWNPSDAGRPTAGDTVDLALAAKTYVLVDTASKSCSTITVRSGMDLRVIQNAVDLAVSGNVAVESGASVSVGNGSTCTLSCGGNWDNNGTFNYNIGGGSSGTVAFTGGACGIDADGSGNTGTGSFYNLTISGTATLQSNVTVANNLSVTGTLNLNGYTLTVSGSATVSGGGALNVGSGTLTVLGNLTTTGATLNNGTGVVNLAGSFTSGTYNYGTTGTFNYNGTTQTVAGVNYYNLQITGSSATLGNNSSAVYNACTVNGAGKLDLASYTLTFANGTSITVDGEFKSAAGGTMTSAGYYGITLNGVVNVSSLTVNRPNDNGVTINSTVALARFDNVTFTNGQNAGDAARYIYFGHSSGAVSFTGHNIDANCDYNVVAPNGISVTMVNSSGAKGGTVDGELNDGDIDANIAWTNPVTWQGDDATNPTLWSVGENWNTGTPPPADSVVVIPNTTNKPVLDTDTACFIVTIENGASITLSVPNKTLEIRGRELGGQFNINTGGTVTMSAAGTVIKCGGTWTKSAGGTFTATNGTVVFHSQAINQSIPSETFYNLTIDKPNGKTATAAGALTINGGLSVTDGTFDTGAYTHTVSGTTDVYGTLNIVSGGTLRCVGAATVKAGGTLNMTGASTLALQASLTVDSGASRGVFSASGSTPTVTWYNSTRYSFTVNGRIDVSALNFQYPGSGGLTISDGATITALNNVSFTNGLLASTAYQRILDTGTTAYFLSGSSFDANCQYNAYVPAASGITVNMVGTSGAKGGATNGPLNESDGGNHINWYDEKTWVGGQAPQPDQWNERRNWSPNAAIPAATDYLRILNQANNCRVDIGGATCKGVVIPSGGVLSVIGSGNTLTVGEYMSILSGGTLVLNNEDSITIGGSWTNNGTFTLIGGTASGTVVFNGTTTLDKTSGSAGAETFDNLTVSGAMTITDGDSVIVSGTFTPSGTINAGSGTTLTTTGNWGAAPAAFNYGTSTIVLTGTANVPAVTYYNLTIDGALTLASDVTVKNNLVINATRSLSLSNRTITVEGNVTNSGTLALGTGRIKIKGSLTSTGVFTRDTGTVEFNGAGAQAIPNLTYYNVDVNGPTASLPSGATVMNQMNVLAGTLALGSSTLTFGNGGALDVDGTFTSSGGTLASSGGGSYFGINIDGTINVSGLAITRPNGSGLTIQSTATIQSLDNVVYSSDAVGARYLWVGHAAGSYSFVGYNFDNNCTANVVAPNGVLITMVSAVGAGAGEGKDGPVDANITWDDANYWQGDDLVGPTLWSDPDNWSKGTVPTSSDAVIIPNVTNDPILNVGGACDSMVIQSGGLLTMSAADTTLTVSGNVNINAGGVLTMSSASAKLKVGGSWVKGGTFNRGTATVCFYSTASDQSVPAETFYNLEIDKSAKTLTTSGLVNVTNNLVVTSGILQLQSQTMNVSGTCGVYGKINMFAGGDLKLTGAATVYAGGEVNLDGSAVLRLGSSFTANAGATPGLFKATGTTPTVTWDSITRYAFTIDGRIEIEALNFSYPNVNGLTINAGATIVDIDSLAFTNGLATGTYLRALITSGTYSFRGCGFDNDCLYNVEAPNSSETINMVGAIGAKAGESYDLDAGNRVNWYDQKIWDGSSSAAWSTGTNWSGSAEPLAGDDVFVPSATNNCDVGAGEVCKSVEVGSGGTMLLNAVGDALTVSGDVTVASTGTLTMSAGALNLTGNWAYNGGTATLSGGTVTLNGSSQAIGGAVSTTFNTLTLSNNTTVTVNKDATVSGALTIGGGSILTIPAGTTLTVNGTISGAGTVRIGDGTLDANGTYNISGSTTFTGAGRLELGGLVTSLGTFTAGTGTVVYNDTVAASRNVANVSYYNLEVDDGIRTATIGFNLTPTNIGNALIITGTSTVDVNASVDLTGRTLTFGGAGQIELGGAVTSLGAFTAGTGTVRYNDTVTDRTVANVNYYNLNIACTGQTATIAHDLTPANIGGTLTITGTSVVDANGSVDLTGRSTTFTAGGRLQLGGAAVTSLGTLTPATGTVRYDKTTGDQTVCSAAYNKLDIANGAWVATAVGSFTVSNDLTISGTFDVGTGTVTVSATVSGAGTVRIGAGTLNADATSTYNMNGGKTTFTGAGRLQFGNAATNMGTFTPSTGTVEYADTTTLGRDVLALTYNNLEIDTGALVITAANNFTVGGNLVLTSGIFSVATRTVTVTGTVSGAGTARIGTGTLDANGAYNVAGSTIFNGAGRLQLGGDVTSLGTLTPFTGTVEYDNAAAAQAVYSAAYNNLEIDNGARVATAGGSFTVAGTLTNSGSLTISPGVTLTFGSGAALNSTGTFTASGTGWAAGQYITMKSSSGTYAATIAAGTLVRVKIQNLDTNGLKLTGAGGAYSLDQLQFSSASGNQYLWLTGAWPATTLRGFSFGASTPTYAVRFDGAGASGTVTFGKYDTAGLYGDAEDYDVDDGAAGAGRISWEAPTAAMFGGGDLALLAGGGVKVSWTTLGESGNAGFTVLRRSAASADAWAQVGVVPGAGESSEASEYEYADHVGAGVWEYIVRDVDFRGHVTRHKLGSIAVEGGGVLKKLVAALGAPGPVAQSPGINKQVKLPEGLGSAPASSADSKGHRSLVAPIAKPHPAAKPIVKSRAGAALGAPPDGAVKVYTKGAGLVGVDLAAVGMGPWRVVNRGEEVGSVVSGGRLVFYARAIESRYTDENVYWLVPGRGKAHPMGARGPARATVFESCMATSRVEDNALYYRNVPHNEERGDGFFSSQLFYAGGRATFNVPVTGMLPGAGGKVRFSVIGLTSYDAVAPDHHLVVLVNGYGAGSATWDGDHRYTGEIAVGAGVLTEGANSVALVCPGDTGAALEYGLVDWVEIEYERNLVLSGGKLEFGIDDPAPGLVVVRGLSVAACVVMDVTDEGGEFPVAGVRVEADGGGGAFKATFKKESGARRYAAACAGSELAPTRVEAYAAKSLFSIRAEYLTVSHKTLLAGAERMAEYRRTEGLSCAVVDVADAYDEFGWGILDPEAVKKLVAAIRPKYLLLVGDATFDTKGADRGGELVPTYLVVLPVIGETADDNRFGCMNDSDAPDVAVGRIPARTVADVDVVLGKTMEYEGGGSYWAGGDALLVADNDDGAFMADSDAMGEALYAAGLTREKAYISALGTAKTKAKIVGGINAGVRLVTYLGHGYLTGWAAEKVFSTQDMKLLTNSDRPVVVVSGTCLTGLFVNSERKSDSMGEVFLMSAGKGAAAFVGSSGMAESWVQGEFMKALAGKLAGGMRLGDAFLGAKGGLGASPDAGQVKSSYTILGDPALRVFE